MPKKSTRKKTAPQDIKPKPEMTPETTQITKKKSKSHYHSKPSPRPIIPKYFYDERLSFDPINKIDEEDAIAIESEISKVINDPEFKKKRKPKTKDDLIDELNKLQDEGKLEKYFNIGIKDYTVIMNTEELINDYKLCLDSLKEKVYKIKNEDYLFAISFLIIFADLPSDMQTFRFNEISKTCDYEQKINDYIFQVAHKAYCLIEPLTVELNDEDLRRIRRLGDGFHDYAAAYDHGRNESYMNAGKKIVYREISSVIPALKHLSRIITEKPATPPPKNNGDTTTPHHGASAAARRGRKSLSKKETGEREALVKKWLEAKDGGTSKRVFCSDNDLDEDELNTALDWKRKRQK